MATNNTLLEVRNLQTHFHMDQGLVRALNGVDFTIARGQTVGLVGESGCGKSVTARSILRIVPPPGEIVGGEIIYHRSTNGSGQSQEVVDLVKLDERGTQIRSIRGGEISMDLSGADDVAQPCPHHRQPDHRSHHAAPGSYQRGSTAAGVRDFGAGSHASA